MEQKTAGQLIDPCELLCRCAPAEGALVHCITNPISINLCANGLLALGCRPVMVEHPQEVRNVTISSDALLLNLGNITDVRIESMKISAEIARFFDIPIVLDAVGVGCSSLRRELAKFFLESNMPWILKGNYSEICALCDDEYRSSGVDGDKTLSVDKVRGYVGQLAKKYECTVLASGKDDIISDGGRTVLVSNGREMLSRVTGTGCLLGAVAAASLTSGEEFFDCAVAACDILEISAEMVEENVGCGSFPARLLDEMSHFSERKDLYAEKLRVTEITDGGDKV